MHDTYFNLISNSIDISKIQNRDDKPRSYEDQDFQWPENQNQEDSVNGEYRKANIEIGKEFRENTMLRNNTEHK